MPGNIETPTRVYEQNPCVLLSVNRNHAFGSVRYTFFTTLMLRRDFSEFTSLSAEPGRPVLFTMRSAVNSSSGGTYSVMFSAGCMNCPLSNFVSRCQSMHACESDVHDRLLAVASWFRAVPPPFSAWVALKMDTPSGVFSDVNPLLNSNAARFSSPT